MGDRWVTFDCFGTIVDWNAALGDALASVFEGEPRAAADRRVPRRRAGGQARERLPAVPRRAGRLDAADREPPRPRAVGRRGRRHRPRLADDRAVRRPLAAGLEDLRERGWRLAILTNCDDDLFAITRAQIPVPFDEAVTAQSIRTATSPSSSTSRSSADASRPTPGCTPRTAGCTTSSPPRSSACRGSGSTATTAVTTPRSPARGSPASRRWPTRSTALPPQADETRVPVSARDALAAALRERVLTGLIAAGTRLTELGVAAEFGVARPTARAAIDELAAARLLRHEANRGAVRARVLDDAAIHDQASTAPAGSSRSARSASSPAPARAARCPGGGGRADRGVDQRRVGPGVPPRAGRSGLQCPRRPAVRPAGRRDPPLAIVQCRRANESQESLVAEHAAILDAIAAGDADAAEAAFHHHLDEAVRVLTVVSR